MVQATDFVAADNASISGEIISIAGNTVTIRLDVGLVMILPRGDIELIRYAMNDGSAIEGQLRDWDDGTYVIDVDGKLVGAKEGVVVPAPATPTTLAETPASPVEEGESGIENVRTAASPVPAAATETGPIEINATVSATSESASALDFDISLSRQADYEIVLIYATIDGTAKSGEDYHAQSGVLVLPAGTTSTRLTTPLIDDDVVEGEESLTLFMSVSPDAATVPERYVSATIEDDDR